MDTEHGLVRNLKARSGRILRLFWAEKFAGFDGQRRPRLESENTSGQDVGHGGATLVGRQRRWVVEWSVSWWRCPQRPSLGYGRVVGDNMVNRLYLLTYPVCDWRDEDVS